MNKLFEKIEDFLNLILVKSFQLFILLLHKALPPKVFILKDKIVLKTIEKKQQTILWIISLKPKMIELQQKVQLYIQNKINFLKSLPWKKLIIDNSIEYLNNVKGDDGFTKNLFKLLYTIFSKISRFIQSLSPAQLVGFVFITATAFLGIVNVYVNSYLIIDKSKSSRAPASAEEIVAQRPEYYKKTKRSISLQTVVLPLFVENKRAVRTLTVDFEMFTSTRFSAKFLDKNENKVRDYLLMTMEPIDSNFPLNSEEGKEIIKQKIIRELNNFLIQERVEGEVTEVRLIYILGV